MTASWAKEVGFGTAVSNKYGRIVVARYRPKKNPRTVSGTSRHGGLQDESLKKQSDDNILNEPGTKQQLVKAITELTKTIIQIMNLYECNGKNIFMR